MHNYSRGSQSSVGDDLFFSFRCSTKTETQAAGNKSNPGLCECLWNCHDGGWTESTGQFQFSPIPDLTWPPPLQASDRLLFMIDGGDRFILKLRLIFQDPHEPGEMDRGGGGGVFYGPIFFFF